MIRIVILSVLVVGALSAPKGDSCPLLTLREDCTGQRSECWSPGESDVDCPNNGICCFDGCANTCGVPAAKPEEKPTCAIEFVTQEETVEAEMCVDIPGEETCVDVTDQVCHSECEVLDDPAVVNEQVECCTKTRKLVCQEKPCDPDSVHETTVPATETVCKKAERKCFNVPEHVCEPEEVEQCKPVETQACTTVKKPTEWPTTRQECSTHYTEKCSVVYKEFCGGKKHHHKHRKCAVIPHKECSQQPWTSCKPITTITIEFEDVEECQTVVKNQCETKIENKCRLEDREECIEAHETCETREFVKTVPVKANCNVPDRNCAWEDFEECETVEKPVEKWVPRKECKDVCVDSKAERSCKTAESHRDCRTVPKIMTYDVPVHKCS